MSDLTLAAMRADLIWIVLHRSSTINVLGSFDHGPAHWARVRENALRLAAKTPGADLNVVEFFALFHDSMRLDEYHDPEHGLRGAQLAEQLNLHKLLPEEKWALFYDACVQHDMGFLSENPTIGVCWDADRLDLGRVGITPNARFMSTQAAGVELGVIDE